MEQKRILRVVVASPGDVQPERDSLPGVVDEINRAVAAERGLSLQLHRWETDAYPGFHAEGPQGLIDPLLKVEDCDILIGIFWKRFGTPTSGARSGTEHEIMRAYEAWNKHRRPQIMVYFNQRGYSPNSKEDIEQWGQVLDFRANFPEQGLWWPYRGKAQFEKLVRNHLINFIRDRYPLTPPGGTRPAPARAGGAGRVAAPARSLDQLTAAYAARLTERLGRVYVFGEAEARPLDRVFVELTVVEGHQRPPTHSEFLGMMDAELRRRRDPFARDASGEDRHGPGDGRAVRPQELLSGRPRCVITGAPGCGKTTLLKYLALKTHEAGARLPVFLELKAVTEDDFRRARGDLAELLFQKGLAAPLRPQPAESALLREFFLARLQAGGLAVFLDGLDEVSGSGYFPRLRESVGEFLRDAHQENTLIISTRPYALQARFEGLKQMEIAPLSAAQIAEFFSHYYGDDPTTKRLLYNLRRRRPLRAMMGVPFLLSIIARLYREQNKIAESGLEVYRQVVWQLAVQLDREKSVVRSEFRVPDRGGALKLDFLRQLAFDRLLVDGVEFEGARLVFSGEDILTKAKQFWEQATPPQGSPYDLADDVKATPLLREVGTDFYAFSHLTLQEYLAALALSRREDCVELFCRAYFDPFLAESEVLPMALGLARDPAGLYAALEQLAESLTLTNLRLRVRSLAYSPRLSRQTLSELAERVLRYAAGDGEEEKPYRYVIRDTLAAARGTATELIAEHFGARLKDLGDEDRKRAVETLGEMGGERSVDVLIESLGDDYRYVRMRAVDGLERLRDERAVGPLRETMQRDSDSYIREKAAEALARIGAGEPLESLVEALGSEESYVKGGIARAVGQVGGAEAADVLLNAIAAETGPSRGYLIMALDELPDFVPQGKAAEMLLAALRDEDALTRAKAAAALARAPGEHVFKALVRATRDRDSIVRRHAIRALGERGEEGAADALIQALRDSDAFVRGGAAESLGKVGGEKAMAGLIGATNDRDGYVRRHALESLALLGGDEEAEALLYALGDPDGLVRSGAVYLLGERREARAAGALAEALLTDGDSDVRLQAAYALGEIGGAAAKDALLAGLADPESRVRAAAANALGQVGGAEAVGALLKAREREWYDEEEDTLHVWAEGIGKLDSRTLADGLRLALSHKSGFVRRKAAEFVGYYDGSEEVRQKLTGLAERDRVKAVRSAARAALEKLERRLRYFTRGSAGAVGQSQQAGWAGPS